MSRVVLMPVLAAGVLGAGAVQVIHLSHSLQESVLPLVPLLHRFFTRFWGGIWCFMGIIFLIFVW